jgi:predicted small metal-binding protein
MKLFHCGIDVIHNEWQTVEAENEQEAIERVKKFISDNQHIPMGNIDVHSIDEEVSNE